MGWRREKVEMERGLKDWRLESGEGSIPPGMSCLLANTSSRASFISRSRIIRWSSWRASSIRVRSLESMTKMRPWVPGVVAG